MITIDTKQFHTNLESITLEAQRGHSFLIVENGKPVFSIQPVFEQKKKYTLADLKKLRVSSGDRNLSQNIDDILYGSSNS